MRRGHNFLKLTPRLRQLAMSVVRDTKRKSTNEKGETVEGVEVGFDVHDENSVTFHGYKKTGKKEATCPKAEAALKAYIEANKTRKAWFSQDGLKVSYKVSKAGAQAAEKLENSKKSTDKKGDK